MAETKQITADYALAVLQVRRLVKRGTPLEDALKAVEGDPAYLLGLNQRAQLQDETRKYYALSIQQRLEKPHEADHQFLIPDQQGRS